MAVVYPSAMTRNASTNGETAPADRCAALQVGGEQTIIYDSENVTAWIQSDGAVSLAEVQ